MRFFAPLEWRLWARVRIGTGCWVWTGSLDAYGYGQIGSERTAERPKPTMLKVHRVAYEQMVGPIPEGMVVDHACNNRSCVNPEHLRVTNWQGNSMNRSRTTGRDLPKGVSTHPLTSRLRARIRANGKETHLGFFDTPKQAHEAYCRAATTNHKEFANFGDKQ